MSYRPIKNVLAAAVTTLAIAGCIPSASEPSVPATDPSPRVDPKQAAPAQPAQPVRSGNWTGWPRAAGDWVYRTDDRGSIALFGPMEQDAAFTVRCDRAERLIVLSRKGTAAGGARMTLRASQGMAELDVRPVDGRTAYVAAGLAPTSEILDQLAYSRGHFAVEVSGIAPMKIPAWPELARVVDDCR